MATVFGMIWDVMVYLICSIVMVGVGVATTYSWKNPRAMKATKEAKTLFQCDVNRLRDESELSKEETKQFSDFFEERAWRDRRYQDIVKTGDSTGIGIVFTITMNAIVLVLLLAGVHEMLEVSVLRFFSTIVLTVFVTLQALYAAEYCLHHMQERQIQESVFDKKGKEALAVDFKNLFTEEEWAWAVRFAKKRSMSSFEEHQEALRLSTFTKTGLYFLQWLERKKEWETFVSERQGVADWFDGDLTNPTPILNVTLMGEELALYEMRKGFEQDMAQRLRVAPYVQQRGENLYADFSF